MSLVIDVWANCSVVKHGRLRLPEADLVFARGGNPRAFELGLSPKQVVSEMDAAGVDLILMSAWSRPGGWIFSNEDVAEFTSSAPSRIKGLAAVDLSRPAVAVRQLRTAVTEFGFVGLRVVPWLWELPPNDKLYFPLFVECIELGVPFFTQVGHTGPLKPSETGRPNPYLDEVLLTFPELVVVGGHIGYPWTDETIALAWKHENFYIDTSAHLPAYYPDQLLHFLETYGREKVMFGTNYPHLRWARCLKQVRELVISDEARAAFLGGNAAALLGIDASD